MILYRYCRFGGSHDLKERMQFKMRRKWFAAKVGCAAAAAVILLSPAGTRADSASSGANAGTGYAASGVQKTAESASASSADSTSQDSAVVSGNTGTAASGSGSDAVSDNGTDGTGSAQASSASQDVSGTAGETAAAGNDASDTDTTETDISAIKKSSDFYPEELKQEYGITFSDDFGQVMSDVESEYRNERGLAGDRSIYAGNWQDVTALLLLEMQHNGANGTFVLDSSCRDRLAEIFDSVNEVVPADDTSGNTVICKYAGSTPAVIRSRHVADLLKLDDERAVPVYSADDRAFLIKYTSEECLMLSTASVHADGFICQNAEGLSAARTEIVRAACSLVGKVTYSWGGKYLNGGLDCSGFVSWSFSAGASGSGQAIAAVGNGTTDQWNASTPVSEADARPGDLVFLQPPTPNSINHVGIIAGRTSEGNLIAVHCNANDNGVVVEDAYKAGFRYVRRPNCLAGTDR